MVGQVGQVRLLPQTLFYLSYSSYPSYLIKFAPNGQVTFSRVFYEARLRRMKQNLAVLCFFAHPGKKNGANDRNRQGGRSPTKSFRVSGSNRRKVRIAIGGKPIRQSGDINAKMTAKFYFESHF